MKFVSKLNKRQFRNFFHGVLFVWVKYYKWSFLVAFIVVTVIGGLQWRYYNLEKYRWSPEEVKAFLDTKIEETTFQEVEYQRLLERVDTLKKQHSMPLPSSRDLFSGAIKKES